MRDARELSAKTGDAMRWFAYSFALVLPWISLGILGPWPGILTACAGVGFWLWWIYPPVGLNRRPATWLLTVFLIISSSIVLLVAEDSLQQAVVRRTA